MSVRSALSAISRHGLAARDLAPRNASAALTELDRAEDLAADLAGVPAIVAAAFLASVAEVVDGAIFAARKVRADRVSDLA